MVLVASECLPIYFPTLLFVENFEVSTDSTCDLYWEEFEKLDTVLKEIINYIKGEYKWEKFYF